MRTEEGKGIDSSIQAESGSGMEKMESEDRGRLVRESVERAIILRDVCRDGSKTKGRGIQGWEYEDTEGPKNEKESIA